MSANANIQLGQRRVASLEARARSLAGIEVAARPYSGSTGAALPSLDPETMPSLLHLLYAPDIPQANGTDVNLWNARVGANATQAVSGASVLLKDHLGGVSGADAVRFNGTRGMDWSNMSPPSPSTTWSLAMLFAADSGGVNVDRYLIDRGDVATLVIAPNFAPSGNVAVVYDGTTVHALSAALDDGSPHLIIVSADGAGVMSVWVDGVLELAGGSYAPTTWVANIALASQSNETSAQFTGAIGAVWYWEGDALDGTEAAQITQFVRDDWGLELQPGAGGPSGPLAEPSLVFALDARDIAQANASPVALWPAGVGSDAIAPSGKEPSFHVGAIGAGAGVYFDGVNDTMAWQPSTSDGSYTVVWWGAGHVAGNPDTTISQFWDVGSPRTFVSVVHSAYDPQGAIRTDGLTQASGATLKDDAVHLFALVCDLGATTATLYRDGVALQTDAGYLGGALTTSNPSALGAWFNGLINYGEMTLGGFWLFDEALDGSALADLQGWCESEWGAAVGDAVATP